MLLVPPIATLLAKSPIVDEYKLDSLRTISCGAAPLGPDVEDQLRKRFPRIQVRQREYRLQQRALYSAPYRDSYPFPM